jgi:putative endonuclease
MTASFVGQGPQTHHPSYFVYILQCADGSYYTGCTSNLTDRLNRHSRGSVPATLNRRPIQLVTYVVFSEKYKAFAFEKYLKTGSGRAFLNKRLI